MLNINLKLNQENTNVNKSNSRTIPTFKAAGMTTALNLSGNIMQSIENSGFLGSFLIQDFCGMTIPRTVAGFLRDKESTGKYNKQEGLEVFGREGLTGPCMMAVAPLALYCASKFGKTTSVNTQLIKRFGNSLKELITNDNFDKRLLNNAEQFKQEFYRANIKNMLCNSLGRDNVTNESVEYILKQIKNYERIPDNIKLKRFRGKSQYRNECLSNIVEHIDNIRYNTSSDLNMLQKVKMGSEKFDSIKSFSTRDAIDAMIKYSDDAIILNKRLNELNELQADGIKNKSLAKRILTNISMMVATLGVLSILPKIYARSNIAPGAVQLQSDINNNESSKDINFKGKAKNSSFLEKLGKLIDKNKSDFISKELEYNGHNFTNSLMAGLSIFGLLIPRGMRAYSRAQVDETGKKDYTEIWEIILRDLTSSLAVVFAVPMLTRACVTSYEKKSGFVLMQKDRNVKSKIQTCFDLLNPYSKAHVLTNSEIKSLYNNIDTKEKILNFCKYINENGGDLQKIISKTGKAEIIFNEKTQQLSSLRSLSKSDKNKKIISVIEKLDCSKANELVKNLMKSVGNANSNKITTFARGLTSVPGLLTTFFISPYLLGWFIPRLTYKNTRRIHEKQAREKEINNQKV